MLGISGEQAKASQFRHYKLISIADSTGDISLRKETLSFHRNEHTAWADAIFDRKIRVFK